MMAYKHACLSVTRRVVPKGPKVPEEGKDSPKGERFVEFSKFVLGLQPSSPSHGQESPNLAGSRKVDFMARIWNRVLDLGRKLACMHSDE